MASADSNIRTIQVNTAGSSQQGVEMGAELPSGPQAGGSRAGIERDAAGFAA
jgi:hypothetical protein